MDNAEWLSENRVKASGLAPSGANLGLYAITGMTHITIVLFR